MNIICCIPARYNSTRLEGKPLLKINGKTIINHVYDRVMMVNSEHFIINKVVVLTDDIRIKNEVESFGGYCIIIKEDCLNGTDRICWYLDKYTNENLNSIIVNVQGDEPFIDPDNIMLAIHNYIDNINDKKMVCSTLYYETTNINEIKNPSRGKLVLDNNNNIMYCSRNIIPVNKKQQIIENHPYKIHIGVFVFNRYYLMNHYRNNNTMIQLCEDIEWMKIMEQGYHINAVKTDTHEIGIDTIDDYNYLLNKFIK
jgi:3-deoxy-manno-octulosonate cytidylyltransferase (CMP-KDO synthetase)